MPAVLRLLLDGVARAFALLLAHRRRLLWLLLLGVVLPWAIFLKASSEIEEKEGFYGDAQVLRWVHAHATPALDMLNLWLTRLGGPLPMVGVSVVLAGLLIWRKQRRHAWFFGVAVGGGPQPAGQNPAGAAPPNLLGIDSARNLV